MVERYYNEAGEVGILYSPGYGAGWSTWGCADMAVDARLVSAFDNRDLKLLEQLAEELYPNEYLGGMEDLEVKWLEKGTKFRISEYDGFEAIVELDMADFMEA